MASLKVNICLKKKTQPEHTSSVTFVTKIGAMNTLDAVYQLLSFHWLPEKRFH